MISYARRVTCQESVSRGAWFAVCTPITVEPDDDFCLQGYMSGKDFARSVVCSVHTNQIEEYLAKVDALPDKLTDAKVPALGIRYFCLWHCTVCRHLLS